MRLRTVILCLLFCIISASAKDVITKTDGTKLDAKVEEITETHIKYRKASNLTGPIYTIAIESVATITYENGEVEKFNNPSSISSQQITQASGLSDEELIQMSKSESVSPKSYRMSDSELLKLSDYDQINILKQKAGKYRKIAWIGAGTILSIGLITGLAMWRDIPENEYYLGLYTAIGAGAATIWAITFHIKAHALMKQAKQLQAYSVPLIENEIINFGNYSLTAGINMMGNHMTSSYSFGPSIRLSF